MAVKKTFEFFFRPLLKKFFQDMGRDPNNLEMILLKQKAGQQLKDSTKVIEFPQKKSFMKQVEAMKKSGDIVDEDNIIISDKITEREMFKNSNLNKEPINEKFIQFTIQDINKKEPIEGMKIANKIIKREGEFKDLTEEQSKKILTEVNDHIMGVDLPIGPEDLAKGGRAEYDKGGFLDFPQEILNFLIPKTQKQKQFLKNWSTLGKTKHAKGGRAGFYTGGITDVEPSLDDIGHGADALMARTRLMSPGSQTTTSTGLNYLLAEDNDNMRIPFGSGGLTPEDYLKVKDMLNHYHKYKKSGKPKISKADFAAEFFRENNAEGGRIGFLAGGGGRRAFLKFLASIGGLTAAAKSGMIGLGEGVTKKGVSETVKKAAGSGQPPPYFFKLVEKIKTLGDDVTAKNATQERQQVTRYKDFELTEDVGTGEKTIQKIKTDGPEYYDENLAEEVYMNYKPGAGQSDEVGRVADEYIEDTGYLRTSGPDKGELYDSMDGLTDDSLKEILEEVGETVTKKADGGRIGFRFGGSGKKFLEKIFGKEAMKEMPNRDPEMYQGMLEVVDMFRAKDKQGLKMYLQKFLPHMDDETIEAFIVGDAVDAAGQGKYGLGNIQGQLIRLGSGRDYAGKIEAFKRLERNKALKDLEVTEDMKRKPNASGGLQTMLGE